MKYIATVNLKEAKAGKVREFKDDHRTAALLAGRYIMPIPAKLDDDDLFEDDDPGVDDPFVPRGLLKPGE